MEKWWKDESLHRWYGVKTGWKDFHTHITCLEWLYLFFFTLGKIVPLPPCFFIHLATGEKSSTQHVLMKTYDS